jgi:hypothetical protein
MYRFHSSMVERPHSIRGGPGSIPGRCSSIIGIWREVLGHKHNHIMYRFHSSVVERPHSISGDPGSIPRRCSSIFGIWREVLGHIVYIIYRDIPVISHITITYRYIMYFFRTFKKSTAPYKVHNMGLRYIKKIIGLSKNYRIKDGYLVSGNIFANTDGRFFLVLYGVKFDMVTGCN